MLKTQHLHFLVLIALTGCTSIGQSRPTFPECDGATTVIRGVTAYLGEELVRTPDATIVIREGRIAAVAPDISDGAECAAVVVDGRGLFALPGLWDLHVHITKATPSFVEEIPMLGITGVRDMGSDPDEISELRRRAIAGGHLAVISSPGAMIDSAAALSRMGEQATLEPWSRTRVEVPGDVDAIAEWVDSLVGAGADFVKVRTVSDAEQFRAIGRAAVAAGYGVAVHPPPAGVEPSELGALGVITVEHGSYPYPIVGGERPVSEIISGFRESATTIVPTLVAWKSQVDGVEELRTSTNRDLDNRDLHELISPRLAVEWNLDLGRRKPRSESAKAGWLGFWEQMIRDVRALHEGGVAIGAGSDVGVEGVVPGRALFEEMCLLNRMIGVDPMTILRSATSGAARLARRGELTGSITPGKRADLILLREDPVENLEALETLQSVYLAGELLQPDAANREVIQSAFRKCARVSAP